MAKLSIYNEIVDEETKVMLQDWCGTDGVCFKDIHEFLNSMEDGDKEIDLHLHCPGGDCIEGWAIYDALRTSSKDITATIDGECASMATIILLAAPKERRFGNKNARLCIHNPCVNFIDLWSAERLTADELEQLKTKLTAQQLSLVEEQNKILDLYVERTGSDRGALQSLMNEDKYVDMEKAIELGFISATVEPNTASKKSHKSKFEKMEKTTIKNSVLKKLLALTGFSKVEDVEATVLDQKITAADGAEFTVEREDGDPQVGDKAYPNGTYTLDDGTVIVVTNEEIESITPAGSGDDDNEDLKALQEKVTTLEASVETLTSEKQTLESEKQALADEKATLEADKTALQQQVTDLTNEKETLTAEKQSLTEAQKTEEEAAILDIVAKAGGKAWLDGVCQMTSTFHPGNRSFKEHGGGDRQFQGETKTQRMLREQRERQEAKRNAKK